MMRVFTLVGRPGSMEERFGRIQRLPAIDESLLIPGREYRVRLRALLATEQYSAPLRLLFFWRDEWQLKSEWYA